MKRIHLPRLTRRWVLVGVAIATALFVGSIGIRLIWHPGHGVHHEEATVYYCPMHPTYTSPRPGDCPICNMRLVKQERPGAESRAGRSRAGQTPMVQSMEDVCTLHNCPKVHDGRTCPMLVVAKAGEAVTCPLCGTHVTDSKDGRLKKLLYWTDPMMPGYKSDKPGKSPMGMDLVPVYEENGAPGTEQPSAALEGYAPILVTPQKRQFIGVTTAPVQRQTISRTIRTVGQIANDPELYQAQQEYLQAVRALEQAKTGTMPEVMERAQRLMDSSRVRLRRLGLNNELIDEIATWEGPDQSLILADPSGRVWVYAPIYEYELPLVKVGQTLTIEIPAIPGKRLEGAIRAIDPVLDPATRSARVRAVLTDPENVLRPEMFVNASIALPVGEVLAIPEEAVFHTGTQQIVFVDKGQGLFEPRDVTVGVKADGYYEVRAGVAEGELVVTSGNFLMDSESRLKAALQGVAPPPDFIPPPVSGGNGSKGANPPPADKSGGGVAGGEHQHGGQ